MLTAPQPRAVALGPRLTVADTADGAFAYSEHSGYAGDCVVRQQRTNSVHVFSGQFSSRVDFSALSAASVVSYVHGLSNIFLLEYRRQMRRVYAISIMTGVSDLVVFWYRTMKELIRNPMSVLQRFLAVSTDNHGAVPHGVGATPRPARGGTTTFVSFPIEPKVDVLFWGRHRHVHMYVTLRLQQGGA